MLPSLSAEGFETGPPFQGCVKLKRKQFLSGADAFKEMEHCIGQPYFMGGKSPHVPLGLGSV